MGWGCQGWEYVPACRSRPNAKHIGGPGLFSAESVSRILHLSNLKPCSVPRLLPLLLCYFVIALLCYFLVAAPGRLIPGLLCWLNFSEECLSLDSRFSVDFKLLKNVRVWTLRLCMHVFACACGGCRLLSGIILYPCSPCY